MKQYIVCKLYEDSFNITPSVVGAFDTKQQAGMFATLSRETDAEHHYAVYNLIGATRPM